MCIPINGAERTRALMDQLKTNQLSATVLPETSQNGTQKGTVPGVSDIFFVAGPAIMPKMSANSKHLDIIDFACSNVFQSDNNEILISQYNGGNWRSSQALWNPNWVNNTLSGVNGQYFYYVQLLETETRNTQNNLDYMLYTN